MSQTSIEKPRKTHRETRVLRTLRPERLSTVGQEILDLSGKNSATLHFLTKHPCPAVKLRYASKHTAPWYNSFPENTRGFLYYHHSPNMPKLSGSVHFRICDSPELFDSGRDLLSLKGDAWGYKDPNLIKDPNRLGFLSLLRDEKLIDEELIKDITKLEIPDSYLHSLSQPFIVDVAHEKCKVTFITRAKLIDCYFPRTAFFEKRNGVRIFPLSG
jgi:hypothetical protein